VLLDWPQPHHLWIGRNRGDSCSQRSANARKHPCWHPGIRPELRFPRRAAQPRIVSVARIRLDSRKSGRPFKGIFCGDISEIAVGTLIKVRAHSFWGFPRPRSRGKALGRGSRFEGGKRLTYSPAKPGRPSGPRLRYQRSYSPRVVGGKVMTPADVRLLHTLHAGDRESLGNVR
jgi:hypothetical protein